MDDEIAAIYERSKMTSQSEKFNITGLGTRLRITREAMHLTQKEAAARLYLNPKIVEIIENEAFSEGPPMTFMRGYLRSYARLLNLPESEVKAAIDELESTILPAKPMAPILHSNPIYRGDRYIRWITYLIVLTLISLVVIWWSSHSKYVITDTPSESQTATEATTAAEITTPVSTGDTANDLPPIEPISETTKIEPATPPNNAISIQTPAQASKPTAVNTAPVAPQAQPITATALPATTDSTSATPPPAQSPVTPPPSATTAVPGDNLTANNMLEATAPEDKPLTTPKKKHRRHQYRPIENMEIPEPE